MKRLFTIIFIFLSLSGIAQNFADKDYYLVDSLEVDKISTADIKLIDSCLTFFHKAKDDTTRLKAINTIVEESWDDNVWPKYNMWTYLFVQQKLKESPNEKVKRKLLLRLAGSINNIGYYESTKGNLIEALTYYKKGLKIQQEINSKEGMATSYNNIGTIHKKQGDIPNSLEYYHKSLKIYKEIDNPTGLGQALNNIGNIYQEQGDPDLALEYFYRGRNLYKKLGDERSVATILNNIGYTFFKKKNIPKALEYYNQSIAIREKLNDRRGIATCYNNIASAHEHQRDNDLAMEFYLKSNQIYNALGYKLGVSTSSVNIGRVLLASNKLAESKKYGLLGLELAEKAGSIRNIQGASELLSKIYALEGKGMKALEMHKLSIEMRDSIDNVQSQKALIQQNAKYQYQREKARDDAEHEKLMAIQEAQKEKQTIISYSIGLGLLFAIIFGFFIFNRLKVTRKQKALIETQNNEIVDSITYAKRIQEAILSSTVVFENLFPESFIYYQPKDIIAGDFYWIETVSTNLKSENPIDDLIFFAAADCTGHGVPGAMVSVVCNNALNAAIREHKLTDPGQILNKASDIVVSQFNKSTTASISNIRDGMDIALCVLNKKSNELHFAGANNPLWVLKKGANAIEEIKANRQAVGKIDHPKPFKTNTLQLRAGDQIYLFSDGFADQFGGKKGKKMMKRKFKELLVSISNESMKVQESKLKNYFNTWKRELDQIDDVCVMGIRIS